MSTEHPHTEHPHTEHPHDDAAPAVPAAPDPEVSADTAAVVVATFPTAGEAEVAQAKLRGAGVESFLDDQVEGGTVLVDGESGVHLVVHPADRVMASTLLSHG